MSASPFFVKRLLDMRLSTALSLSISIHVLVIIWLPEKSDIDSEPGLQFPVRSLSVHLPRANPTKKAVMSPIALVTRVSSYEYQGKGRVDLPLLKQADTSKYYLASELDQRPAVVGFFNLDDFMMPPEVSGSVTIRLWVNEMGNVDIMEVERASIPEEVIRHLLTERFDVRFEPGKKNHGNVKSIVRYELEFFSEAQKKEAESRQSRSVVKW